jgi:hypothetical protein
MKPPTMRSSLILLALAAGHAHGATLAFLSNTTVTSDSALDAPLVLHPTATLAQAVTFGGSAQTVATTGGQTISFSLLSTATNADMPAAASGSTAMYNAGFQSNGSLFAGTTGDTQFDAVIDSGAWHNNGSDATRPMTLRIGSLIMGQTYLVSLFSADARSSDRAQAYWDTFSGGTFSGGTSGSLSQNPGTMTMFTFTANAAFQDIFIEEADNIGNADTNLSAFTLYAIPEPSCTVLAAGAAMVALLRRRRI